MKESYSKGGRGLQTARVCLIRLTVTVLCRVHVFKSGFSFSARRLTKSSMADGKLEQAVTDQSRVDDVART